MRNSQVDVPSQFQNMNFQCPKGKSATHVCITKQCDKIALICDQKNPCQCKDLHQDCNKVKFDGFLKKMIKKSKALQPTFNKIEEMLQEAINQLSEIRDQILAQLTCKHLFQGLNENQLKFINSVKNQNVDDVKGQLMWQILFNLDQKPQNVKSSEEIENDIKKMWHKFNDETKRLQKSILNYFQNKIQPQISFKESKILKITQQKENLLNFFDKRKIKSAQLLYRASDNQFLASKFHEKCDNIEHTMTLIQTKFNKIVGGYTPIRWSQANQYATSPEKSSFIFSLTNNQKLNLVKNNNAQHQIYCGPSYGPVFGGGHDFYIYDKANRNKFSSANIGLTYQHQNYPYNCKQTWKRFTGGQTYKFSTKEWQVWKVTFE